MKRNTQSVRRTERHCRATLQVVSEIPVSVCSLNGFGFNSSLKADVWKPVSPRPPSLAGGADTDAVADGKGFLLSRRAKFLRCLLADDQLKRPVITRCFVIGEIAVANKDIANGFPFFRSA